MGEPVIGDEEREAAVQWWLRLMRHGPYAGWYRVDESGTSWRPDVPTLWTWEEKEAEIRRAVWHPDGDGYMQGKHVGAYYDHLAWCLMEPGRLTVVSGPRCRGNMVIYLRPAVVATLIGPRGQREYVAKWATVAEWEMETVGAILGPMSTWEAPVAAHEPHMLCAASLVDDSSWDTAAIQALCEREIQRREAMLLEPHHHEVGRRLIEWEIATARYNLARWSRGVSDCLAWRPPPPDPSCEIGSKAWFDAQRVAGRRMR